ncbi:MAG TPA: glycosyltransferase family 4 protein [Humisphaera sp.]
MARIVLASHHPGLTTSYARVAREFVAALRSAGHAVSAVGSAPLGEPVPADVPYPVEAVAPEQLAAAASRAAGTGVAGTGVAGPGAPDLLVTVGDPWMFDGLDASAVRPACRWLACFPLDGVPVPREWIRWMAAADARVVFSRFAADAVRAATGLPCEVVPHGVDRAVFRPADKPAAKRRVVGDPAAFVVGCVAANQQRKNLPALLNAFAAFAAGKPEVLLYLHAPVVGHWDLEALADRLGITDRVRATLNYDPRRGLPDADLATVYNAFDVLALPTMGEGFGLPLLEAQACGVPAVATDCSSCPELLPDPAQRVRVRATLVMARNVEQAVVDEADLAAKLDAVYHDAALRRRLAAAGLRVAAGHDWADVRAQLRGIVAPALR